MNLFNHLRNKTDYAVEFKKAYESHDISKLLEVFQVWSNKENDDANLTLAMILIGDYSDGITSSDLEKLYEISLNEKPKNSKLFEWYNQKAKSVLAKNSIKSDSTSDGGSSGSYEEDFKRAYEADDVHGMEDALERWDDKGSKNYKLAKIMLSSIKCDVPFTRLFEDWQEVLGGKTPFEGVFTDWFEENSLFALEKRVDIEASKDPELEKIVREAENTSVEEYGGNDEGFSSRFLVLINSSTDGTDFDANRIISEISNLLDDWNQKFPNDANRICAYIIFNIHDLNGADIGKLMMQANSLKPIDESNYAELLEKATIAVMQKTDNEKNAPSNSNPKKREITIDTGDSDINLTDEDAKKYSNLDCKGLAKVFIDIFEHLKEGDVAQNFSNMVLLIMVWEDKCPRDANMICARTMIFIENLDDVELEKEVEKAKNYTPADPDAYNFLFGHMMGFVRFKQSEM